MKRIIITVALSPVDVDNLLNHVNLVFLSLTFSLNLFSPLLIAALSTTIWFNDPDIQLHLQSHSVMPWPSSPMFFDTIKIIITIKQFLRRSQIKPTNKLSYISIKLTHIGWINWIWNLKLAISLLVRQEQRQENIFLEFRFFFI